MSSKEAANMKSKKKSAKKKPSTVTLSRHSELRDRDLGAVRHREWNTQVVTQENIDRTLLAVVDGFNALWQMAAAHVNAKVRSQAGRALADAARLIVADWPENAI